MQHARILVIDDDPLWQQTLLDILQPQAGYVATASSLSAAVDQLNRSYFNVAVVDLSLQPSDPTDEQGMAFLRELQARHLSETVRPIILSAYGTNQKIRDAFRDFHVVDFLEKVSFSAPALVCAVRQALVETGLNREVGLEFVTGGSLHDLWQRFNWARREEAAQLSAELYDLLRRLFRGAEGLIIRDLPTGQSGAGVLRVEPYYPAGAGTPVVVKFGKKDKLRQESDNYVQYVKQFVGAYSSTQLRYALGRVMGAVSYQLIGTEFNRVDTFADYYRQHTAEEVCGTLDRLFTHTCGRWYDNRDGKRRSQDFIKLYQAGLHINWDEVWQGADATGVNLAESHIRFPGLAGKHLNPRHWLTEHAKDSHILTWQAITHGDLNEHNILVSAQGDCWLIDFYRTGLGHILRDVIELETALKFRLTEFVDLSEYERFEKRLLEPGKLTEPLQVGMRSPRYKPLTVINHLRRLADPMAGSTNEMTEYYWGLLLTTLNLLRLETFRPHWGKALLSAALVCERLARAT